MESLNSPRSLNQRKSLSSTWSNYSKTQKRQSTDLRFTFDPKATPKSNKTFTCNICYVNPADVFTKCRHIVSCHQCLKYQFNQKSKNGQLLSCSICKSTQYDSAFINALEKRTQTKLKFLKRKSTLSIEEAFRKCQKPDCQGYILQQNYQCLLCQTKHCAECKRMAHTGLCLGKTNYGGDIKVKNCNFCKTAIYKEDGCSKINCFACKRTICFVCLQEWSFSHHGCQERGWFMLPLYLIRECFCQGKSVIADEQKNELQFNQ